MSVTVIGGGKPDTGVYALPLASSSTVATPECNSQVRPLPLGRERVSN